MEDLKKIIEELASFRIMLDKQNFGGNDDLLRRSLELEFEKKKEEVQLKFYKQLEEIGKLDDLIREEVERKQFG